MNSKPTTRGRNSTRNATERMVATATMAADVLAHLPPRKRLKATAQIPSTSTSDLPPPVSLLALGAQRLKHAQEKDMITDDHGRPAGPKMNPMSPTTLMRVAGSFDNDATVRERIRPAPSRLTPRLRRWPRANARSPRVNWRTRRRAPLRTPPASRRNSPIWRERRRRRRRSCSGRERRRSCSGRGIRPAAPRAKPRRRRRNRSG